MEQKNKKYLNIHLILFLCSIIMITKFTTYIESGERGNESLHYRSDRLRRN